jgi:hypothetical protein
MKPLLETKNFQKNIDLFLEQFQQKLLDFKLTCCDNSITKVDFIDFTLSPDVQYSDSEYCNEKIGRLHSILVYAKIFLTMHSETISTNLSKGHVQLIVKDIFDLMIALKKFRIKTKVPKYFEFIQTSQSDEKAEETRKILLMT